MRPRLRVLLVPVAALLLAGGSPHARPAPEAAAATLSVATPNPTSGRVTLRLTLPRQGTVRLLAFDGLGRQVATLIDGVEPAGRRRVVFDGSRLPSGTYVLRLETPSGLLTRRVTIL